MIRRLIIVLAFLWVGAQGNIHAQERIKDKIVLVNGSIIAGEIIHFDPATEIEIVLRSGESLLVPMTTVRRVVMDGQEKNLYPIKTKRLYHQVTFSILPNLYETGIGGYYTTIYQQSQLVGYGFSIGLENYENEEGRNIIPVLSEYRAYIVDGKVKLYAGMRAGYGFAIKNETAGYRVAQGGFNFNPQLGVMFNMRKVKTAITLGYKQQDVKYHLITGNIDREESIQYKRYELGISIML